MAEAILSDTATSIIKSLEYLALQEIGLLCRLEDELKRLGNTVSTIQAVLLDAEEQQAYNHEVKDWLGKLKDALFEADDLLDDYSTELLRRQVMTQDKKAKQIDIHRKASIHEMGVRIIGGFMQYMLGYVSLTCRQNNGHYTEHFHDEQVRVLPLA